MHWLYVYINSPQLQRCFKNLLPPVYLNPLPVYLAPESIIYVLGSSFCVAYISPMLSKKKFSPSPKEKLWLTLYILSAV